MYNSRVSLIANIVHLRSAWFVTALACMVALAVAVGVAWNPLFAIGGAGVVLLTGGLWLARQRLPRLWLALVWFVLLGYMFLDRGFAYLGVPPLFIGELTLFLGALTLLLTGGLTLVIRQPIIWLIALFAIVGTAQTLPYLGEYRMDALRDAVLWGYALFAVAVAVMLLRTGWLTRIPAAYRRWFPLFLAWAPIGFIIERMASGAIPRWPNSDVAIIDLKPGDLAVHLAGIAAFIFLGLHESRENEPRRPAHEGLWWSLWLIGGVFVASINRGGFLAICTVIAILFIFREGRFRRWLRLALTVTLLLSMLLVFDFRIDLGLAGDRVISPRQVLTNVLSIVGSTDAGNLSGTREWRLEWWNTIIGYTVNGDYFWTGKGYGINLAADDGFLGDWFPGLRSPHNGHLTILARSGVPGMVVWIALQATFAISIIRGYLDARRRGQRRWSSLFLWVLAYWAAVMVNASFDVVLEGPQQGIWFWCIIGCGVAALEHWRRISQSLTPGVAPTTN